VFRYIKKGSALRNDDAGDTGNASGEKNDTVNRNTNRLRVI